MRDSFSVGAVLLPNLLFILHPPPPTTPQKQLLTHLQSEKERTACGTGKKRGPVKMSSGRKDHNDGLVYNERPAESHKASSWYQLAAVKCKKHR